MDERIPWESGIPADLTVTIITRRVLQRQAAQPHQGYETVSNTSAAAAGKQNETVIDSKLVESFSVCAPDVKRLFPIDPRHSFDHSILVKLDCPRIRSHADIS